LAFRVYEAFFADGIDAASPLQDAQHQLVLGDKCFVAQHADRLGRPNLNHVAKVHRRLIAMDLQAYEAEHRDRAVAMARACHSTAFTMKQIGLHFKVND